MPPRRHKSRSPTKHRESPRRRGHSTRRSPANTGRKSRSPPAHHSQQIPVAPTNPPSRISRHTRLLYGTAAAGLTLGLGALALASSRRLVQNPPFVEVEDDFDDLPPLIDDALPSTPITNALPAYVNVDASYRYVLQMTESERNLINAFLQYKPKCGQTPERMQRVLERVAIDPSVRYQFLETLRYWDGVLRKPRDLNAYVDNRMRFFNNMDYLIDLVRTGELKNLLVVNLADMSARFPDLTAFYEPIPAGKHVQDARLYLYGHASQYGVDMERVRICSQQQLMDLFLHPRARPRK